MLAPAARLPRLPAPPRASARGRGRRGVLAATALTLLPLFGGCALQPAAAGADSTPSAAPGASTAPAHAHQAPDASPAAATSHALRGEILRVDAARDVLLVHHEEIPGFMPAMAMEFTLGAGVRAAAFLPGQQIAARFVHAVPGELRLDDIRILPAANDHALAAAARSLRADTAARGSRAYRALGETAPAFTLLDQDGAVVPFERFRGRRVVLNFIFTRCPIPTMCLAAVQRLQALQAAAHRAGLADVHFVSISFDPDYDTPPVLRAYAAAHGIDTRDYSLLTGPPEAIADLLRQFGVYVIPGRHLYLHSLATILVGADGRLLHRTDEAEWDVDDFLARLRAPAAAAPPSPPSR